MKQMFYKKKHQFNLTVWIRILEFKIHQKSRLFDLFFLQFAPYDFWEKEMERKRNYFMININKCFAMADQINEWTFDQCENGICVVMQITNLRVSQ